ncbi:hypothetical protein KC328_g104 [Hortaea werneckii]|nr:hypothetical protein KC328_g104 [Hortaea werneckii]
MVILHPLQHLRFGQPLELFEISIFPLMLRLFVSPSHALTILTQLMCHRTDDTIPFYFREWLLQVINVRKLHVMTPRCIAEVIVARRCLCTVQPCSFVVGVRPPITDHQGVVRRRLTVWLCTAHTSINSAGAQRAIALATKPAVPANFRPWGICNFVQFALLLEVLEIVYAEPPLANRDTVVVSLQVGRSIALKDLGDTGIAADIQIRYLTGPKG